MKRRNLISKAAICLYLVLALVLCVGCSEDKDAEYYRAKLDEIEMANKEKTYLPYKPIDIPDHPEYKYMVIVIDSCEYIYYDGYRKGYITHKGNCKYCAKRALAN